MPTASLAEALAALADCVQHPAGRVLDHDEAPAAAFLSGAKGLAEPPLLAHGAHGTLAVFSIENIFLHCSKCCACFHGHFATKY